jgi:succinyl-diaminopimelate desuccinylase
MSIRKVLKESELADKEVAELTSGLVQFNSAHPEGRTDECVAYIKEYMDLHGIKNEIHAKEPKKPNLVARLDGESKRTVLWVGHLDVVPEGKPENWTYPPYSGKIRDGKVHGRGSSDMKGSCAAAMVAARILSQLNRALPNTVEFWFTCDEEIGGGVGARWLAETSRFRGDVCVIGDGNGGGRANPSIDLGCKGGAQTRLIAKGKTAHGSQPYLGDNAIEKLIKAIPWVYKIGNYRLDIAPELEKPIRSSVKFYKESQPMTPNQLKAMKRSYFYPTVTCNIIDGGVKINVVPDYAEAEFDIRLTPGTKIAPVRNQIEKLVKEAAIPGVEVAPGRESHARGSGASAQRAGYYESPDSPFAKQLAVTIKRVTGKRPSFKILTGGTDGVSTSKIAGIPSLGYGTSLTGQAHEPDEYITVENLVLGIKVYAAFPLVYKP